MLRMPLCQWARIALVASSFHQSLIAQKPTDVDVSAIREVMNKAMADWNAGNLDDFATCYKNAPDILFVGPHLRRGYAGLLKGYREAYPTRAKMGTLTFDEIEVQPLDRRFATMTGRFHLERAGDDGGNQDGYYLLVYERTHAGWKIIRDDSTVIDKAPK